MATLFYLTSKLKSFYFLLTYSQFDYIMKSRTKKVLTFLNGFIMWNFLLGLWIGTSIGTKRVRKFSILRTFITLFVVYIIIRLIIG